MNNAIKMVVTLSLISALAAGALAFGDKMTREKIKMQAKLKAARAVQKIFPKCKNPIVKKIKNPGKKDVTFYLCPDSKTGFIFTSKSASGLSRPYSGLVKMMIGVDSKGTIAGLEVIKQSETPGLGANIAEQSWLKQFVGLSLTNGKLLVKKVDKSGSIDAISGATISSKAVTSLVKAALVFYKKSGVTSGKSTKRKIKHIKRPVMKKVKGKRRKIRDRSRFLRKLQGQALIRSDFRKKMQRAEEKGGRPKSGGKK
jgi:H+/Na+-translocating ferredoxin:NAD+ oxidoreductase subunit G